VLPGKKYKPEDFLAIAWRHRWVILVPLVVCALATFAWSRSLPNRYRSEAFVLIIPPQVPESLVRPTITESLQERLNLMRQQILSRTRLERIILEFNLYSKERQSLLMEQIVERMRVDIGVNVPKVGRREEPGHFVVSFDSESPQTAMVVAERLASLFIRENLQGRGIQADATSQFLQSQVDESLRRLQAHEARLEAFRRNNAGRLPEEVESNLQMMQSARQDLQAQTDGINRDRDRQITIERSIADEITLGPISAEKPAKGGVAVVQTAAQELAAANAALATLQLRLEDDHPDVRIARQQIAALEKKAEAEALQQPLSDGLPAAPLNAADAERVRRVSNLRAEFDSLERGIQAKRAKAEKAQATIAEYRRRVETGPMLASQLSELMRDYSTLKATYEDLLRKTQAARLSANVEQRQAGEQFRIIDPARRPERPHSPNRVKMNLIGAIAGLGLGLVIVGLLEYRDTSLRTDEDVLVALSLPVLALVPTMWTMEDARRRRRRLLLFASSAAVAGIVSLATIIWKFGLLDRWGR
jgi:polysaccharide chain length determinant protein (PEP-CTERM system associated)